MSVQISDLTIASAAWNCSNFLEANWKLISEYSTDGLQWVVANNQPSKSLGMVESIPNFKVIEGVDQSRVKVPERNRAIHVGSFHHAAGLNKTIRHIKTRYVLFLDPDFFIGPSLLEIIDHMDKNNLAFFGTPYAIDSADRVSHTFPCVYCMFVDTTKVDISKFDFTPQPTDLYKGDTGTKVYLEHLEYDYGYVEQSAEDSKVKDQLSARPHIKFPHTKNSLSSAYGVKPPQAAKNNYFWKEGSEYFGSHIRMKVKSRDKKDEVYSAKGTEPENELSYMAHVVDMIQNIRKTKPKKLVVPLFRVFMHEDAITESHKVLRSGHIAQGSVNQTFEKKLVNHFSNKNIVTVNSGTSALHLAFDLIKEKEKLDESCEVICSPLTCAAGLLPIVSNGLSIKWCDIESSNFNIDLNKVAKLLNENTRILSFVHWGGYPIDYQRLQEIKKGYLLKYGKPLYVVEDCAHAWGSTWNDLPVGGVLNDNSTFSCFSFQAIKSLTTGDGGLLITPPRFKSVARRKRWFGIDRDNKQDFRSGQPIEDLGFKFHMNDISSAIGIGNMPYVRDCIEQNREHAHTYYENLQDLRYVTLPENKFGFDSSYWLFTIKALYRDELKKYLLDRGVQTNVVHSRNDKHPVFKKYSTKRKLSVMNEVSREMLCLPVGWWMTPNRIRKVVTKIKEFYVGREG